MSSFKVILLILAYVAVLCNFSVLSMSAEPSMEPVMAPISEMTIPKPYSFTKMDEGITTTTLKYFTKNPCFGGTKNGKKVMVCPMGGGDRETLAEVDR